jgi:hypothetical protein
LFGGEQLIARVNLPALVTVVQMALRPVGVGVREHGANVLETDAVLVERGRIQVDAHRRQRAAADVHLPDPFHLRKLLLQNRGRRVVHLAFGHSGRRERENQNRRIRRIDFAVIGIARQIGGQLAARSIDRRLHVARSAVDVTVQIELHDDRARTERAGRSHLGHAGDASELTLERRGHRGGHRLRGRARQRRGHADRRKIHLRQRRHRQQTECCRTGKRESQRQQRGGDRPVDEGRGQIHGGADASTSPRSDG